ncbi:MAG: sugar porter family MFS transporter [Muribaculaceae bacterium]|nr:sugar porter family MFS transporter [Muribaculaceae bacterium]
MSDNKTQNSAPAVEYMETMPLRWGHFRVLIVSSMEQIIGAALSTVAGIIIPMVALLYHNEVTGFIQGLLGAAGLIGISLGAALFGKLGDKYGYLGLFRIFPLLMVAASLLVFFTKDIFWLIIGLFIIGLGVGGGYSLDTAYISEIMPKKWQFFMVGIAKASCSLGFFGAAGLCWWILTRDSSPEIWNYLILIVGGLGLLTFLMRIPFRESPRWLMSKGRVKEAEADAKYFLGKDVEIKSLPAVKAAKAVGWLDMFRGENLKKVIFSGIPWACEGVGVYGVGVFLPLLVIALGIEHSEGTGMVKIINSVKLTTVINFFIVPGFILGLLYVRKMYHVKMLTGGFMVSALSLGLLLAAYLLHWPVWVSIVAFLFFELFLNAGPHLITFIIPAQIYTVDERGAGTGIASMLGKVGAILGVFFMPLLLKWGGITLVLIVCISVMVLGALISAVFGRIVLPPSADRK